MHPTPMHASFTFMYERSAAELVSSAHHLPNRALCSHYGLLRKDPIKKKIHSLSLEFWNLEQLAFTEKD